MDELQKLKIEVEELKKKINKDNFSNLQVFTKDIYLKSRIKVLNRTANLGTCQTGELSVVGGKLYICSATDTWTVVGTQS